MASMAETRWLDDDQQRAWRRLVAVAMLLPAALDAQLQRDAGLTHFAYLVLAMLSEAPGRALRMTQLAARANSSQSRLSHVVGRLEERGWVRRERSSEDARGNVAVLTEAGWDKVVASAPGHVAAARCYIFDSLAPAQVRQLDKICTAALARLDPDGRLSYLPPG
jgi:DNA-binding MarR family transcriptional regulator